MRVSYSGRYKAPHKAILMISVTQLVSIGYYQSPVIILDETLKKTFKNNWHRFIQISVPFVPDISIPFNTIDVADFVIQSSRDSFTIEERLFNLMREQESSEEIEAELIAAYLVPFAFKHKVNFSELNPSKDNTLRPYQIDGKKKIYQMWTQMRSIMFQMPTGTGKTKLFTSIAKDLFEWGREHKTSVKILFMAHRTELIHQISESIGSKYGLAHGLIVSKAWEQKYLPYQVSSVQTLVRRLNKWEEKNFDIIIIDEAHHVKAESYKKILKTFPRAKVLGVTATPYRLSHESFRPEFDELITSMPVAKFINEGYLCDYEYYSIKPQSQIQMDINSIKLGLDGDYLDMASEAVMDRDEIRARIVDTYEKLAKGKKGIVYTITKAHNLNICHQYCSRGYKAVAIDDSTPAEERKQHVEDFRRGKIDIICNVNIFSEGFDCPDLEFIQLARPTKSLSMYLQQVGRGLRPAANKEKLIILDNVGLYNRFGFPSARRHWRYHFEGQDIDYSPLPGGESTEEREINYFDEFYEGEEDVEMLHTSIEEAVDDISEVDDSETPINEVEFRHYMLDKLEIDVVIYKKIFRGLRMDIDNIIRRKYNHKHRTIFDINDVSLIDLYLTDFRIDPSMIEMDSSKNHIMTESLGYYRNFLLWKSSEDYDTPINESNEPAQEELAPRTWEEVEQEINVFKKYGRDIPEELLNEYNSLSTK